MPTLCLDCELPEWHEDVQGCVTALKAVVKQKKLGQQAALKLAQEILGESVTVGYSGGNSKVEDLAIKLIAVLKSEA